MTVAWDVPANDTIVDGVWRVGRDIRPGIYRTIPPKDSFGSVSCFWSRLKGLSGGFDDILANDIATAPVYVEILATDFAFDSTSCGTWMRVE